LLDSDLYDAYLASFDFACDQKLKNARSLVIVAVPQPQIQLTFLLENKPYPAVIPPTYYSASDNEVADLLKTVLKPQGYQLQKVRLPEKLLAVRSEATVLEHCEDCSACRKACPTHAMASDRFQLYAERCLTFHNESSAAFPQWLSPSWHNCLVGCMICQKACPANKDVIKWIKPGATFDNEETGLILDGVSKDRLPRKTFEKIKRLDMMRYYDVLRRNLKALIEKPG
jgi:epoxyqueuosine reductase